ncbi:LysR family transcriptional regulator [Methylobacterium sp. WL120]|uniref:LysR family transcriptional regulator n=1 Tax=Methylobacterium sp. WL120 TaxID=2603887 RepID=UPI0011CC7D84|nr:LysR family transcriptional regulator [Methylobacterium sp. WL120]TXM68384.1 LysR family transcriptional regulator [Methylobacterium sp. WL120]
MNHDPDWALYRTLLALLDAGSLSAAARALGTTQPTVARHVDALESALGADLFVRSQRGLEPTELAVSLRPHARTMATTAAALLRAASGAQGDFAGTVRITASDVVGVEHLPPILTRLRRAHPALAIELALSDVVGDLLAREADIAIRMVEPTQGALLARRLPPVDLGFHAHRDYLDRAGTPAAIGDLSAHDVIGYDTETPALRAMGARLPPLDRRTFALRADSNLAQVAAIRSGFGIGICQVAIARRDPALVRVLPAITLTLPLWIVMHEDLKTNARCRAVFDALVEGLDLSEAAPGATATC